MHYIEIPTSRNVPSFEDESPKMRKRCYLPNGKPLPLAIRNFPERCTPYVHKKPKTSNISNVPSYETVVPDTPFVEKCTIKKRIMPDRKAKQKLPQNAYKGSERV